MSTGPGDTKALRCRFHLYTSSLTGKFRGVQPRPVSTKEPIPMFRRQPVKKARSVKQFRRNVGKTKAINLVQGPMRGGIRL